MARPQFSDFHERSLLITGETEREREKLTADVFVFCVNREMKQKKTGNLRVEI
jgi:hypothetical protein